MGTHDVVNLIVVAHPDDEILGFGGTGASLVARGEIVQPIILCGDVEARSQRPDDHELNVDMERANSLLGFNFPILGSFPNIRMNNVNHIDIVQFIERQILDFQPTRIFTHHPSDLNNDHLQVSRACAAAARLFQRRTDVRALQSLSFMEILSSTDWSFPGLGQGVFLPNQFVPVKSFIDIKIQALGAYRNVMRPFPHPRCEEVIKGLAAYRGGQCGLEYAEAFQTIYRRGL